VPRHRADFGAIRQLPSGRWQVRYSDQTGRRRTASTTYPTRSAAARFLATVRADLDRGEWFDPDAGTVTLAVYADSWLALRRVRGRPLAPRTAEFYRWELDRHLLPSLGAMQLRRLTPAAVRGWHARLSGAERPGAPTVAKCYRLLRAICASAVSDEHISRNPCVIPGAGQETSAQRPSLTVPEVYALADGVGPAWRAVILLAAFAGLRFGELAALRKTRVDLLHGTVTVAEAVSDLAGGVRHVGPPKSEAGRRTVAIPPHMLNEIRMHLEQFSEPAPDGLVFVGPQGGPLRNSTFSRSVWRPSRDRLGLSHVHFHDLRGCAATLAAISGATTAELMARFGHTTPDMAMRYQRATADRDAALARALSAHVEAVILPLRRTGQR